VCRKLYAELARVAVESDTRSTCLYLQICVNTFVCVCLLTDVLLTNVFSKCVQEAVRRAGQGGCGVRRPEHMLLCFCGSPVTYECIGLLVCRKLYAELARVAVESDAQSMYLQQIEAMEPAIR